MLSILMLLADTIVATFDNGDGGKAGWSEAEGKGGWDAREDGKAGW